MPSISKYGTRGILELAVRSCAFAVAFGVGLAPASADTVTIHMKTGPVRFEPKSQNIKVGDTIEWVNDAGTHTATPDPGQPDPFQGSPILAKGEKYSVVITGSPRTIKYHCDIHGAAMTGDIVVSP